MIIDSLQHSSNSAWFGCFVGILCPLPRHRAHYLLVLLHNPVSSAVSDKGLDVLPVQVRTEVLSKQRVISHALTLPASGGPGFRFESVSYRIQCMGQLMFRTAHPFRGPRGLISSFLPGDSWLALIKEIRRWQNLQTLKAQHVILIFKRQGKRILQDLHCRLTSVYPSDDTWKRLDIKLDLLVIVPCHPEERKYRNVISLVHSGEWYHPIYRSNKLIFLDFSRVPNLSNI